LKTNDNNIKIKKQKLDKLSVPIITGYLLIDCETILYLEAKNTYTTFHLTDNTEFIATKNLGKFEKQLFDKPFLRTHNSFIVNLSKVKELKNVGNKGEIILINNHSIPISRRRKDVVLKLFK
jgi:two-component system LytT family response regulator